MHWVIKNLHQYCQSGKAKIFFIDGTLKILQDDSVHEKDASISNLESAKSALEFHEKHKTVYSQCIYTFWIQKYFHTNSAKEKFESLISESVMNDLHFTTAALRNDEQRRIDHKVLVQILKKWQR
ncbi:hypothetical protein Glove_86g170 [Diversispora epigaea]|uniref:Uncharacterized protein n=1 Tax=Diversispora epigaea TaxID=1348612 RepID=A0A397JDP2_9GLOM|nr:hypothetical protein Glove_86g170 [Diversispora epigaea]